MPETPESNADPTTLSFEIQTKVGNYASLGQALVITLDPKVEKDETFTLMITYTTN